MVARLQGIQRSWKGARDTEGHRTYKITFVVSTSDTRDGPAIAMTCPGLPIPGSTWFFGNDLDTYAWCRWDSEVVPMLDKEPFDKWEVTLTFSTKPPDTKADRPNSSNCRTNQVEDPLLEPMKISGSFVRDKEVAKRDRFGRLIKTSSHEIITGPIVEFDKSNNTVKIEQNVAVLDLPTVEAMRDTVNNAPLWGAPKRCVKLGNFTWDKKYWGDCFFYYTRMFEFEIKVNADGTSGHDRQVEDVGTMVLHGHWDRITGLWVLDNIGGQPPDPNNPSHFDVFPDRYGNPVKSMHLDGKGQPIAAASTYVSLQSNNQNIALSTGPPWWQRVSGTLAGTVWDTTVTYVAGNLVTDALGLMWMAVATSTGVVPVLGSPSWVNLPTNLQDYTPGGTNVWRPYLNYAVGDVAADGRSAHPEGRILVQKYSESDFTLLGIPLIL